MAFNVEQWKRRTVGPKDFHRAYSYECSVKPPTAGGDATELIFLRTKSVMLPGSAYMSVDNHRPYGSGKAYTIPYVYNPQEITCTHLVDAGSELIQIMYDWTNKVTDLTGDNRFSAYYFNEYANNPMIIWMYSPAGERIKTYQLFNVFPLSIDQTQLSWESNEVTELSVQYHYTHYEVT